MDACAVSNYLIVPWRLHTVRPSSIASGSIFGLDQRAFCWCAGATARLHPEPFLPQLCERKYLLPLWLLLLDRVCLLS
jgi:hypothetical protein